MNSNAPDVDYADRVLGCLLGGAVGDALGYCVEFDSHAAIRERFGPDGIREPIPNRRGKVEVSDDTQMTIFTLAGLLASTGPGAELSRSGALESVRLATLDWHKTQTGRTSAGDMLSGYDVLRKTQAPGNTCLRACRLGAVGAPNEPINNSKGCGGVMRVAPVGLFPELSRERAFDLGAHCAAQTHSHPSGYLSAGAMASIIRDLLDGLELERAANHALGLARSWPRAGETIRAMRHALALARRREIGPADAVAEIGQGWIGEEALAIGLYSVLVAIDFKDAVQVACNHDGDSDSTASIAGQIHGAWKGLGDIPHAWVQRLDVLDPIRDVGDRLIEARGL